MAETVRVESPIEKELKLNSPVANTARMDSATEDTLTDQSSSAERTVRRDSEVYTEEKL